jgi:hypothetical protein
VRKLLTYLWRGKAGFHDLWTRSVGENGRNPETRETREVNRQGNNKYQIASRREFGGKLCQILRVRKWRILLRTSLEYSKKAVFLYEIGWKSRGKKEYEATWQL